MWTPRTMLYGIAAIVVALVLGVFIGLHVGAGKASAKVLALQAQAEKAKDSEEAAKQEAKIYGTVSDGYAQQVMDAGRDVAALKAKLASLKPYTVPTVGNGDPVVIPGPANVDADLIEVRDDIIKAQDVKIAALEGQVTALHGENTGLQKALKLADLRADLQAQASKAALKGIKQSLWLGRAEGFIAGAAIGYTGGKYGH
jgi:hypothetical protein